MQTFQEINNLFTEEFRNPSTKPSAQKKILLIDDNRDIHNCLLEILKTDYELICCYNWNEAESKISQDLDLIILDIKMSDYDGFIIFNRLKEKLPDSKIIFNSAYPGDYEEAKKIENLNHNGYLTKGNYGISELKNTIRKAMDL